MPADPRLGQLGLFVIFALITLPAVVLADCAPPMEITSQVDDYGCGTINPCLKTNASFYSWIFPNDFCGGVPEYQIFVGDHATYDSTYLPMLLAQTTENTTEATNLTTLASLVIITFGCGSCSRGSNCFLRFAAPWPHVLLAACVLLHGFRCPCRQHECGRPAGYSVVCFCTSWHATLE